MARLSLSKPCTLLPLRRAVTRSPREAARYSSADQADMPPLETSGAGSGRSDRIKGLNILGVYLFRKIQSLQIDGVFRMLWRAESSKYLFRQAFSLRQSQPRGCHAPFLGGPSSNPATADRGATVQNGTFGGYWIVRITRTMTTERMGATSFLGVGSNLHAGTGSGLAGCNHRGSGIGLIVNNRKIYNDFSAGG